MKKLNNKIISILTNDEFLGVLWYISCVLWFGFVGRMIITSDLHIILKILMVAGDLWWLFYVFAQHYYASEEDE